MERIQHLVTKICLVYLDDVIVFGKTFEYRRPQDFFQGRAIGRANLLSRKVIKRILRFFFNILIS